MKMLRSLGFSILVHALIVAAFLIRFQPAFLNVPQSAYIRIDEDKPIEDLNPPKPFFIGDEAQTNKKPVINTNFQELQKEEDEENSGGGGSSGSGSGSADFSSYLPSYQVEELPTPMSPINPVYPEEARRTGIEGKVILMLYIDELGNVKKVEIQKSPSDLLSKSASEAVENVRFKPAKIAGNARAVCMLLTLKFHLD
jgi:protein TonB